MRKNYSIVISVDTWNNELRYALMDAGLFSLFARRNRSVTGRGAIIEPSSYGDNLVYLACWFTDEEAEEFDRIMDTL